MLRLSSGRLAVVLAALAMAAVVFAIPASAQTTGAVKGKVVDQKGKPLEKADVRIEYLDGINIKLDAKTDRKGEFVRVGLRPGNYKVTASTKELGAQSFNVRVTLGDPLEVNFQLGGGGAAMDAAAAAAAAAKNAELKKTFEDGAAAAKAGNYDEALAKFEAAVVMAPKCYDCYYAIALVHMEKKDYGKAEEAFNKALEVKPEYVEAYNGLATVYNAQKKFDKASEATTKARELAAAAGPVGAGGVDAEYNAGVIAWNAGKIAEAQAAFLKVVELKPDHAEAHYQLGMSYLNQGKMPDAIAMFEKYLTLAPQGPNAATAANILKSIKK